MKPKTGHYYSRNGAHQNETPRLFYIRDLPHGARQGSRIFPKWGTRHYSQIGPFGARIAVSVPLCELPIIPEFRGPVGYDSENAEIPPTERSVGAYISGMEHHHTAAIHPTASVHPTAYVGPYATVGARAIVGPGARIGGGATIGPRATIAPGALVCSGATVGAGATIGTRATIGARASVPHGASVAPRAVVVVAGVAGVDPTPT